MMCSIDGNTFFSLTKNSWIRDSGALCHITNNDNGMYDIVNIDESIQVCSGIMPTMKKGKLPVMVHQVNGEEQVHTLWSVKFCPLAGANLFSLTCKLSQGNNISSNETNNIVINTPSGDIVLDYQIKTCDIWVTEVDFLWTQSTKGQFQLQPLSSKTSTIYMLSLATHQRPS